MPDKIQDFDRQHIWHPYDSAQPAFPNLVVESADGVNLTLDTGQQLIDGMASWWSALHGYNHPVLNQAIADQASRMSHVMFGGLTHEPAVSLCKTLIKTSPAPLQHVFLADSGSVSVEVALKMALQYQWAKGQPQRRKIVTLRGGYHGDTLGAMSVCDPDTGMHHLFRDYVPEQVFVPKPALRYGQAWDERALDEIRRIMERHQDELAAFILEPIVQGAGGMRFYAREYVQGIRQICDEYGLLLIADEIATAFGRTGHWMACDDAGVAPDILCVGKAITGGYMSLAATLATSEVAHTIADSEHPQLMHGPTFMGNPLACAVANANLNLLETGQWRGQVNVIREGLTAGLQGFVGNEGVVDVRIHGAIGVIERTTPMDMQKVQTICLEEGVWLRPFGCLVYTMPPYITGEEEIGRICSAMKRVVLEA